MLPHLIVAECLDRGIGLIAITDHNSSANCAAVQAAARGSTLTVLPGMEVQSREDVHALCLFDTLDQVDAWQAVIDQALPDKLNRSDYFGDQLVVDENGDFINREDRLLIVSTCLSIEEIWDKVNSLGGLVIPAHVNRTTNGLIPILGKIPDSIPFIALEISRHLHPSIAIKSFPALGSIPLIQGGDAHRLEDILGANLFTFESPCVAEIQRTFRCEGNRSVRILSSEFSQGD